MQSINYEQNHIATGSGLVDTTDAETTPSPESRPQLILDNVLVVIDPFIEHPANLLRAIDSAKITGASLHLLLCLTEELQAFIGGDARATLARAQEMLDDHAKLARAKGVVTSTELIETEQWQQAVITTARRIDCDMIFKTSLFHSPAQRATRDTSDWTLMRQAPCPVLLVKNFRSWKGRRVLGTIKGNSIDATHDALNQSIVDLTQRMVNTYGSEAHFACALSNENDRIDAAMLATLYDVDPTCIHLDNGNAADVILETSKRLEADLVIVGTVAREGIIGRVIGNTSEKILDHSEADVLVIN